MGELFSPNDCNGEFASLKGRFGVAVTNTRNWPRPEIDLVDLFAIKQKYKSTCRAAVIGERQQSALSVHSEPEEAVIQFQPKNNKELTSISATLLGSPADSVPGESRLEESRPRELLYIADVDNCCIK